MNKFPLQNIRMYPIAKYIVKYEKEYFKINDNKNTKKVFTYKRIYKLSELLDEKIIDIRHLVSNANGKII